ncbi:helix-turn-helix domain-containing protein [Paenibacillus sp. UMB4589-SE434]|uniref:MerR family transcriptional regulator n=1 Tax=Paenibacillus sp. UMB4589-SE434 TaxID=3046314 RepID=UPI00254CFD4A|nr:helix-turn-helix domain-containing protein [Paenibacillus sp. UMB4589-SE434]MDK8183544.1 helix-turn-helix domain-containing protein [Paenibacillus sp. UMB4589-SE434]
MFKISEFSKISQVSVKTLRYYDQLNLLKPAHTDKFTGYRYYSADQMFQLHRIMAFKELGFSLDQIRQLLGEDISLEQIRGMFRIKQSEIQTNLDKEQARLDRIKDRICSIEKEENSQTPHEVVLKEVKSQLVISYRKKAALCQIPDIFQELDSHLECYQPSARSKMVLWHDCEEDDEEIDIEVARLITHPIPSNSPFIVKQLPEVPMMATLIHHCWTTRRCTASTELALWIERNGYRMKENEPRREICIPHENLSDPEAYVAEVQIVVERA